MAMAVPEVNAWNALVRPSGELSQSGAGVSTYIERVTASSSGEQIGALVDADIRTWWLPDTTLVTEQYLQFRVPVEESHGAARIVLNDNSLVVMRIDQPWNPEAGLRYKPTRMRLEASADGSEWKTWGWWHINYHGQGTEEYSPEFGSVGAHTGLAPEDITYLRLCIEDNVTHSHNGDNYFAAISEIAIGVFDSTDTGLDYLTPYQILALDYNRTRPGYETDNNHDRRIEIKSPDIYYRFNENNKDDVIRLSQGPVGGTWGGKSAYWTDTFTAEQWPGGVWGSEGDLEGTGVVIPAYTLLSGDGYTDRQPVHEVEHVLYAMPGDEVILEPYNGFSFNSNYFTLGNGSYIRWYDMHTGKPADNLIFLKNRTNTTGFSSNASLWANGVTDAKFAVFKVPADLYKSASDLEELREEYVIAQDMGQFSMGRTQAEAGGPWEYTEPPLAFRHIYRIKSPAGQAAALSGGPENNRHYMMEHTRRITVPADKWFHIRLENPVGAEGSYSPMNLYYQITENGETRYERVNSARLRVYNVRGDEVSELNAADYFEFEGKFTLSGMMLAYDEMVLPEKTLPEQYRDGKTRYYGGETYWSRISQKRDEEGGFRKWDKGGICRIDLVALDVNGRPVTIDGTDTELVFARYEVEFSSPTRAFFDTPDLARQNRVDEARIREEWGDPVDTVDFDEYMRLENSLLGKTDAEQRLAVYFDTDEDDGENTVPHRKFKMPRPWNDTNYSFQYNVMSGHAIYYLANHSDCTPFHTGADKIEAENVFYDSNGNKVDYGKGVYDRTFYRTGGEQRGYFYYVNASDDPGTITRLRVENLCPGGAIHVTAWVNEFTVGRDGEEKETANLEISFVAVGKNGTRVTLHTFLSGHVAEAKIGEWYQIYYRFVPDVMSMGLNPGDVDHYEVELSNNCRHSNGADYAVDDIRVYVSRPPLTVGRISRGKCEPVSEGETLGSRSTHRVSMSVNGFANAFGVENPFDGKTTFHYAILKKAEYDKAIADGKSKDEAFEDARVVRRYNPGSITEYGTLTVTSGMMTVVDRAAWLQWETGVLDDSASAEPVSGTEYYIVLANPSMNVESSTVGELFDPNDPCSVAGTFVYGQDTVDVKIDGVEMTSADLELCSNQMPVVQVKRAFTTEPDGAGATVKGSTHAYEGWFDWFEGPEGEMSRILAADGSDLLQALRAFREEYPDEQSADVRPKGSLTGEMVELLCEYSTGGNRRLWLRSNSHAVNGSVLTYSNGHTGVFVTAVPIGGRVENESYYVCPEPIEVFFRAVRFSPRIFTGFDLMEATVSKRIEYPEGWQEAPVRVTMSDIMVAGTGNDANRALHLPVYRYEYFNRAVKTMIMQCPDDLNIYLAETDDPEYYTLPAGNDSEGLPIVGKVFDVNSGRLASGGNHYARVQFNPEFNFKEGYWYRIKFFIQENEKFDESNQCVGEHVQTVKVVPLYTAWDPQNGSRNWNDDRNWRRVSSDEIFCTTASQGRTWAFTDTGNTNPRAGFCPGRSSNVIIPSGVEPPCLYYTRTPQYSIQLYNINASTPTFYGSVDVDVPEVFADEVNGKPTADIGYDMEAFQDPSDNFGWQEHLGTQPWCNFVSRRLHFMPESEIKNQWYGRFTSPNTPRSLNSGGGDISVDLQIPCGKWNLVTQPLQGVYIGDFYVDYAAQINGTDYVESGFELFSPVTFTQGKHLRYSPAFYHRKWNDRSSPALVYEGVNPGTDKLRTYVPGTWTHPLNDAAAEMTLTSAHALKVTGMYTHTSDEGMDARVRLPKADTKYIYQDLYNGTDDNNTSKSTGTLGRTKNGYHAKTQNSIMRGQTNSGTFKVTYDDNKGLAQNSDSPSPYHLVGNPFMSHLDMARFLEDNSEVIEPRYLTIREGRLDANMMDEGDNFFSTDGAHTPGSIAPMQGFIVQAKDETKSLELRFGAAQTFTLDAAQLADADGMWLHAPVKTAAGANTRSGANELRMSLLDEGGNVLSPAVLRVDADAKPGYVPSEDMPFIHDADVAHVAQIYTVGGDAALMLNSLPDAEGTEVGVMPDAETTQPRKLTIRFDRTAGFEDFLLYDTETGRAEELYDGMTYELPEGKACGRLFLTRGGMASEVTGKLTAKLEGRTLTVTSTAKDPHIHVDVATMGGIVTGQYDAEAQTLEIDLQSGVYAVTGSDGQNKLRTKVIVK